VKDLIPNCEYYFRVKAVNKIGGGDYLELRNPIIAEDPKQPPDPPVDLEVHNPTSKSVTLTWKPPLFDGGSKIMGYIIEKLAKGKERWERCNDYLVPLLTYPVKGLEEGKEYQFRVRAENAAGISEPSRITPFVKAVDPIEAPKVFLAANLQSGLEVKRGDEVILEAHISGSPYPSITWLRNDEVVRPEDIKKRVTAPKKKRGESILSIRDSIRADHGTFTIKVENDHGVAKASCEVNVLDTPGPPVNFVFEDLRKNSVVCKWEPPLDDGGSEILNYVLEKKDNTKAEMGWVTVSSTLRHCKFHVTKLIEGKEYLFRVFAENRVGAGPPCVSKPMMAKDPFSPPDAPNKPDVEDVTSNSMLVKWNEPKDNGSPIIGYWIEKREINSTHWARVNRNLVNALEVKVEGLLEGLTYIFRVCAENAAGPGKFSPPSDPKTAQDPIIVPGPPSCPEVKDKTKSSVALAWKPPQKDGGSPIKGYIVEMQDEGSTEWKKVNEGDKLFPTCECVVPNLKELRKYRFRVKAVNAAGESEPSPATSEIPVQDILEEPEIFLDLGAQDLLSCRAGTTIKIPAVIKGRPVPKTFWEYEGKAKTAAKVKATDTRSEIIIPECNRSHSGRYSITAKNKAGQKTVHVRVNVLDVPGPPKDLKVSDITRGSCKLSWKMPDDDGGDRIRGYVIEKRNIDGKAWTKVNPNCGSTSFVVPDLIAGQEYFFRVRAENRFGVGPPAETVQRTTARDPIPVPGPCDKPTVSSITRDSMTVNWEEPEHDGGSPITGYWLERKETTGKRWTRVNRDPI
ncbi:TITIN protein, partial [Rhagologus leucostigma]|nr:TITIN protein [Rhagologus leucostigma]